MVLRYYSAFFTLMGPKYEETIHVFTFSYSVIRVSAVIYLMTIDHSN